MKYLIPRLLCALGRHYDQTRNYHGVVYRGTSYCTRRIGKMKGGYVLCGKTIK